MLIIFSSITIGIVKLLQALPVVIFVTRTDAESISKTYRLTGVCTDRCSDRCTDRLWDLLAGTLWSKIEKNTDKIAIQSFTVPQARE